jgi:outer membrane protein TolC
MPRIPRFFAFAPLALVVAACESPLGTRDDEAEWRQAVDGALKRQIDASQPADPAKPVTRVPATAPANLTARATELEAFGPAAAGAGMKLDLGPGLSGTEQPQVGLSLKDALTTALRNSLPVQGARIDRAIRTTEIDQAEAAFDAVLVAGGGYQGTEDPQPAIQISPAVPASNFASVENRGGNLTAGLRKQLETGGRVGLDVGVTQSENLNGVTYVPNPAYESSLDLTLDQPLLAGAGEDVALAQVRIAQVRDRAAAEELRRSMQDLLLSVEDQYWELHVRRQEVVAAEWLVQVGTEVRDVLEKRQKLDATVADYSDAVATVEQRKSTLINARNAARTASDRLKLLMNDAQFPVGTELVVATTDEPPTSPIDFSFRESVITSVERNPSVKLALLSIDQADINTTVANNGLLPQLDLNLAVGLNGLDGDLGGASEDIVDADFVSYLAALQFSQPIGNRPAEDAWRIARLQRSRAVTGYQQAVENAVFGVKSALRDVSAAYQLIEQAQITRLAQAENLRALLLLEKTLAALTPEFLALKFQRQNALANAHVESARAKARYNQAIARLQQASGTILESKGFSFDEAGSWGAPR